MTHMLTSIRPMRARTGTTRLTDWLPLFGLSLLSILFARPVLTPWGFVFALSFSIFFGFKWLTYKRAISNGIKPGPVRTIGYIFCWVGMDAGAFLDRTVSTAKPRMREWYEAAFKTALGCSLFWIVPGYIYTSRPLLAGYIGFTGFLLLTFFGAFHLLSLFWRRLGVKAEPVMRSPLLASSPSDFWSARWNLAFRDIDRTFVFRPAARRAGLAAATLAAFLFSGLLHDLVISFPVNAWYWAPTLYFLIQAAAVLLEKSDFGKKAGLMSGATGRIFAVAAAGAPVLLLFHPPSIEHAFIPMMKAAGAL